MRTRVTRERGQVEVETAIVLPAVVFLILGLIQLGMLHQARLMAKYAAYQAVRTGALRNADTAMMEKAAVAAALPILSRPAMSAIGTTRNKPEVLDRITNGEEWALKWLMFSLNTMPDAPVDPENNLMMRYAEVRICGPLRGDINRSYTVKDQGGDRYLAFDDPEVAGSPRTKLRIELTLNYRMPIPFANWVIFRMFAGQDLLNPLRLDRPKITDDTGIGEIPTNTEEVSLTSKYYLASKMGVFVIPIRAQYAMKLHSDVLVDNLPEHNDCRAGGRDDNS